MRRREGRTEILRQEIYSPERFREYLLMLCAHAGSQREWARENGFHFQVVSAVITGKMAPPKKMLKILGLQKKVTYVRYVRSD